MAAFVGEILLLSVVSIMLGVLLGYQIFSSAGGGEFPLYGCRSVGKDDSSQETFGPPSTLLHRHQHSRTKRHEHSCKPKDFFGALRPPFFAIVPHVDLNVDDKLFPAAGCLASPSNGPSRGNLQTSWMSIFSIRNGPRDLTDPLTQVSNTSF